MVIVSLPNLLYSSSQKGQESGVRSQGSGVRSQGSGVRSQESGVRGQESGVRGQGSGVRRQGFSWPSLAKANILSSSIFSPLLPSAPAPLLPVFSRLRLFHPFYPLNNLFSQLYITQSINLTDTRGTSNINLR